MQSSSCTVCLFEHGADVQSQLKFGASKTDYAMAHGCVRPYEITLINCRG